LSADEKRLPATLSLGRFVWIRPVQVSWLAGRPTFYAFPVLSNQWHLKISSPLTVAGQLPILRDSLRRADIIKTFLKERLMMWIKAYQF